MGIFPMKWPKVRRVCVVCRREFMGRPDAQTCSNKCRERLYRSRKAEREKQEPKP